MHNIVLDIFKFRSNIYPYFLIPNSCLLEGGKRSENKDHENNLGPALFFSAHRSGQKSVYFSGAAKH